MSEVFSNYSSLDISCSSVQLRLYISRSLNLCMGFGYGFGSGFAGYYGGWLLAALGTCYACGRACILLGK